MTASDRGAEIKTAYQRWLDATGEDPSSFRETFAAGWLARGECVRQFQQETARLREARDLWQQIVADTNETETNMAVLMAIQHEELAILRELEAAVAELMDSDLLVPRRLWPITQRLEALRTVPCPHGN